MSPHRMGLNSNDGDEFEAGLASTYKGKASVFEHEVSQ